MLKSSANLNQVLSKFKLSLFVNFKSNFTEPPEHLQFQLYALKKGNKYTVKAFSRFTIPIQMVSNLRFYAYLYKNHIM